MISKTRLSDEWERQLEGNVMTSQFYKVPFHSLSPRMEVEYHNTILLDTTTTTEKDIRIKRIPIAYN